MDTSRRELKQLFIQAKSNIEINRKIHKWLKNDDANEKIDFLTTENSVETDFKIAFSCLLSSYRATDSSIEKFLNHRVNSKEMLYIQKVGKLKRDNTATKSENLKSALKEIDLKYDSPPSNLHWAGITALHIAVYRNSSHVDKIVKLILNWGRPTKKCQSAERGIQKTSIASVPMICGSYPLHILTGQNLTINEMLLETLLSADSSIPFRDDINGDNPISLLWKNTLRFRWAISLMEGATSIEYIKNDDCSWMAVITPYQFIEFSLLLAGTAFQRRENRESTCRPILRTIHDLCRIPRCPPMLLQLLQLPKYKTIYTFSGTAHTIDENGMLPIHHAVQNPPVTYKFVPSSIKMNRHKSLVEILLEQNPSGVKIADNYGRLPLHYALDIGCLSGKDVLKLIKLHPNSLRVEDPVTGLLPFMLASKNQEKIAINNTLHIPFHGNDEYQLLSSGNEKSNCMENELPCTWKRYQAEWKRDHVKMSHLLLLLCPDAISSQHSFGMYSSRRKKGEVC